MYFKKTDEKTLSKDLFKNPTSEYRGAPFWAWNNVLKKDTLYEQMKIFRKMGFGGFHMHGRAGLMTEFFSDEYNEALKFCAKKAEEMDMYAFMMDEECTLVGLEPENCAKNIRFTNKKLETFPKNEAISVGKTYFFCAYDLKFNEKMELVSYKQVGEDECCENKFYAYVETYITDQVPVQCDRLNEKAVRKIIERTYGKIKETIGENFGKTVPAIFNDEPVYGSNDNMILSDGSSSGTVPWTTDLDVDILREIGLDIKEKLPEMFFAKENNEPSTVKYEFYKYITDRYSKCYFQQLSDWCKENGVLLTGHIMQKDSMFQQVHREGSVMRHYPKYDIPGMDLLMNADWKLTAKQAQSVVHQYGKEAMISELYGVTNWDFDFRGHKFQGDWQAALGVTVRVPHLAWYSMESVGKRDCPASIFYQSPWHTEYKLIEDHFARLNTALTRGKPVVDVGVIHPIESMWMCYGANDTCGETEKSMDKHLRDLTDTLLTALIDFDFIDEANMEDICKIGANPLKVGEMEYKTIIVPDCITLRRNTLERLKEFKNEGGNLIFIGRCPEFIDGVKCDDAKELYENSKHVILDKTALLKEVGEQSLSVQMENGCLSDNFIHQMRCDTDGKWLFLANVETAIYKRGFDEYWCWDNRERASHLSVTGGSSAKFTSEDIKIILNGEFTPQIYDTMTGEIKEPEFEIVNGKTIIKVHYSWGNSFLFKLCEKTKAKSDEKAVDRKQTGEIIFRDLVDYSLDEPNVMLLDYAEFAIDGGKWNEREEIFKINDIVAEKSGWYTLMERPQLCLPDKTLKGHTVHLKYRINSNVKVSGCKLALERPEATKIKFNGRKVASNVNGWYIDKFIKTVNLPTVKKGENILELEIYMERHNTLEHCYLLGDFGVSVMGSFVTLEPKKKKIGFGSLDKQEMFFYGGNITYKTEIEVPDCDLLIKTASFRGGLVKVILDGEEKYSAFPPYEAEFKNVSKGKHTVEFKLFGNRYNTLGPLHFADDTETWAGRECYLRRDDLWCDEYRTRPFGIFKSPIIKIFN